MQAVRCELNEAIKHIQVARFELCKTPEGLDISERIRKLEMQLFEELALIAEETEIIIRFPSAAITE
jgi:hypothetical protein